MLQKTHLNGYRVSKLGHAQYFFRDFESFHRTERIPEGAIKLILKQ